MSGFASFSVTQGGGEPAAPATPAPDATSAPVAAPAPAPASTPAPAAPASPDASTQAPAPLLGKFKDAAALAEAYQQLEANFTRFRQAMATRPAALAPAPAPAPAAAPGAAPAQGQDPAAPAAPAPSREAIDFAAIQRDLSEFGVITEVTLQEHAARGVRPEFLHSYVAGEKAKAEQRANTLYDLAGGKDKYNAIREWGTANLTPEEHMAFNAAIRHSPAMAKMALDAMKIRYEASQGVAGQPIEAGSVVPGGAAGGYTSKQQMLTDMANPLYSKDPAFRAEVERKLAASRF